jgi:hypothetical protein
LPRWIRRTEPDHYNYKLRKLLIRERSYSTVSTKFGGFREPGRDIGGRATEAGTASAGINRGVRIACNACKPAAHSQRRSARGSPSTRATLMKKALPRGFRVNSFKFASRVTCLSPTKSTAACTCHGCSRAPSNRIPFLKRGIASGSTQRHWPETKESFFAKEMGRPRFCLGRCWDGRRQRRRASRAQNISRKRLVVN